MNDPPAYWFGPKLYIWGYRPPLNWRGRLTYIVWTIIWFVACPFMGSMDHPGESTCLAIVLVAGLSTVCRWKGEP